MYNTIASSIFTMHNFFDEISIIDKNGIIQYCEIFVPNVYSFTADAIIGKHIFQVFTTSTDENSQIIRVLKTGKPVSFFEENCVTYTGDIIKGYSSVYPIFRNQELIGAAVALEFLDSGFDKEFIQILDNSKSIKSRGIINYTIDDLITKDPYMLNLKRKCKRLQKQILMYLYKVRPELEKK